MFPAGEPDRRLERGRYWTGVNGRTQGRQQAQYIHLICFGFNQIFVAQKDNPLRACLASANLLHQNKSLIWDSSSQLKTVQDL